ncbi:hypothetical protein OSTOST_03330 [Ostertagia ostertagi]
MSRERDVSLSEQVLSDTTTYEHLDEVVKRILGPKLEKSTVDQLVPKYTSVPTYYQLVKTHKRRRRRRRRNGDSSSEDDGSDGGGLRRWKTVFTDWPSPQDLGSEEARATPLASRDICHILLFCLVFSRINNSRDIVAASVPEFGCEGFVGHVSSLAWYIALSSAVIVTSVFPRPGLTTTLLIASVAELGIMDPGDANARTVARLSSAESPSSGNTVTAAGPTREGNPPIAISQQIMASGSHISSSPSDAYIPTAAILSVPSEGTGVLFPGGSRNLRACAQLSDTSRTGALTPDLLHSRTTPLSVAPDSGCNVPRLFSSGPATSPSQATAAAISTEASEGKLLFDFEVAPDWFAPSAVAGDSVRPRASAQLSDTKRASVSSANMAGSSGLSNRIRIYGDR